MKQRVFSALLLCAAVLGILSSCNEKSEGEAGTDSSGASAGSTIPARNWPLFRGDAEMQGLSEEDLKPSLKLAWSFEPPIAPKEDTEKEKKAAADAGNKELAETEDAKPKLPNRRYPIEATPVISEGVVFVGGQDSRFFAINLKDGTEKWTFQAEGPITAPAAVFGNSVFFGDTYGLVYALDVTTGKEIWKYETDGKIEGGVNALEIDGKLTLFIGSHDNYLHALDAATGKKQWKHETGNYIVATPSIVASQDQQAILFGGCDGLLHVVSANGKNKAKQIEIGGYIANTSPVADGIAYIANNSGNIQAIHVESRETVWKIATQNEFVSSPAVNAKHLIIGGPDKRLVAYDRITGEEAWAFQARRSIESSPVICESAIWFGGMDGRIYAINPENGEELWSYELGTQVKASPAISAQTLVICGDDGVVYGFVPEK